MGQIVDLTRSLTSLDKANLPAFLKPLARIICPEIEYVDHHAGAKIMAEIFDCTTNDLPEQEGWAEENIQLSSHLGTHVDAPWHFGSKTAGNPSKTIDQIPLDELYCDTVVLDMSYKRGTGSEISVQDLQSALSKTSYTIKAGDAVLIRTDHDKYDLTDPARYNYPGLVRESMLWLAEQGAKVGGTDALGWDRPFPAMVSDWQRTGNKQFIWDAHFACRCVEFYIVQQLVNLDKLPQSGFKTAFFPLKIEGASAAPTRAVAFIN